MKEIVGPSIQRELISEYPWSQIQIPSSHTVLGSVQLLDTLHAPPKVPSERYFIDGVVFVMSFKCFF